MTGGVKTAISCNPFSDDRTFLLCFQVFLFSDSNQTSSWNFTTWCLFMACRFPLNRFITHSHRNRIKSFGQDCRKWLLHLRESHWKTFESREILRVYRPKSFNALNDREHKILTEQIHCLCNNVIYRLSAVTNQSTNDQREQTFRLHTSQQALNLDPTVC